MGKVHAAVQRLNLIPTAVESDLLGLGLPLAHLVSIFATPVFLPALSPQPPTVTEHWTKSHLCFEWSDQPFNKLRPCLELSLCIGHLHITLLEFDYCNEISICDV